LEAFNIKTSFWSKVEGLKNVPSPFYSAKLVANGPEFFWIGGCKSRDFEDSQCHSNVYILDIESKTFKEQDGFVFERKYFTATHAGKNIIIYGGLNEVNKAIDEVEYVELKKFCLKNCNSNGKCVEKKCQCEGLF